MQGPRADSHSIPRALTHRGKQQTQPTKAQGPGERGPRVKDDKVLIVTKFPRLCADMRELSRESENSAQKDGLRAGLRVCVDNTGFARMLQDSAWGAAGEVWVGCAGSPQAAGIKAATPPR